MTAHAITLTIPFLGAHTDLRMAPRNALIWANGLLGRLRIDQWRDAFCAGGHDTVTGERFIQRLLVTIREGRAL